MRAFAEGVGLYPTPRPRRAVVLIVRPKDDDYDRRSNLAPSQRPTAGALPHHAAHPPHRGAVGQVLRSGQNLRRLCHSSIGQEAAAAGVCAHLRRDDPDLQHAPGARTRRSRRASRRPRSWVQSSAGRRVLPGRRRQPNAPLRSRGGPHGHEWHCGALHLQAAGGRVQPPGSWEPTGSAWPSSGTAPSQNGAFHEGLNRPRSGSSR